MNVQGRPAAARVVDFDRRERVAFLGTAFDGEAAGFSRRWFGRPAFRMMLL
jgi:hypothetical protein